MQMVEVSDALAAEQRILRCVSRRLRATSTLTRTLCVIEVCARYRGPFPRECRRTSCCVDSAAEQTGCPVTRKRRESNGQAAQRARNEFWCALSAAVGR